MPLSQHCLSRYLRSCDSLIIPHSFAFVKGFLKSFSNFFEVLFVPRHSKGMSVVSSFRPTLLLYHNSFLLSRGFSKVFKKLFRFAFRSSHRSESPSPMRSPKALPNSQNLGIFHCDSCRFFGSSSIIPHPSPFVNTFLQSFSKNYRDFSTVSSRIRRFLWWNYILPLSF